MKRLKHFSKNLVIPLIAVLGLILAGCSPPSLDVTDATAPNPIAPDNIGGDSGNKVEKKM
ncbi:MAG: hypothetical protein AB1801_17000 [Chloroflexota bacterium]